MTDFQTHTIDSAPEASKPQLEHSQKAYGFVPNLHAGGVACVVGSLSNNRGDL